MEYFTSDSHFFHKKVIEYCNRPFRDVDEMNAYLVNAWNIVVTGDVRQHGHLHGAGAYDRAHCVPAVT
jgi:hypothetical protein